MLSLFDLSALLKLPHTPEWRNGMMILIVVLNVGISWLNAGVCGRSWEESKAVGGILRLTVWCTAIQSAAGFSSVTALPLIFLAREYAPGYFTELYFNGALNLWYLTIIFPTIGADLAITIESWVAAYRDASLLKLSNAAWKTFVQIHNTATAIDNMGGAFSAVRDAFDPASNVSSGEDSDSKTAAAVGLTVMLVIVSIALAGGCLITAVIIRYYAGTVPLPERDITYFLSAGNRVEGWNNVI
jgi:hypothetical protein